jgi:CheY-like chemotaxis protein
MKRNVLIVDDSEFTRNYHSYILREANFEVVTAVDGADALEKLLQPVFRSRSHRHQHGEYGRL